MKRRIILDFESRSASNLKKEGAFKYSLDPTTQPTCLAFKVHGAGKKVTLFPFDIINQPWDDYDLEFKSFWRKLIHDGWEFTAHNAFFEVVLYKNILVKRYGWPDIPHSQFRCTAAKAAACALPRSLEGAGAAMKLSIQKDRRGSLAMFATCRPTRAWNAWNKLQNEWTAFQKNGGRKWSQKKLWKLETFEPPKFLEPNADPVTWQTLYDYCKIDVLAEEALDDALPDLIPSEQELWLLNQEMNWQGIRLDIPTSEKIVSIMEVEGKKKLGKLDKLTMGLVTKPGSRRSIMEFLALEGVEIPDIKAKTIQDVLQAGDLSPDMKALLELRQQLSKTSTRKYQSFLDRAGADHRARDISLYHGGSTGRESGSGLQPHNFPRPLIKQKDIDFVISMLEDFRFGDDHTSLVEWIQFFYGEVGMVFSSLLRGMIIPSKGCELFVADLAKIEVAFLWWLADNWPGLKILNSGGDPYVHQAMANTGRAAEIITYDERQLGKAQTLGAGFGMGADKFQTTAHDQYRLKLTKTQAKDAITSYRTLHSAVPVLWKLYERAAIECIETPGKRIKVGKCVFVTENNFWWVQLPSGRKLAYRDPQITWRETDYGPQKTVEFWGVNPKTKKWWLERTWGGKITENIVQAGARDLLIPAMPRLKAAQYRPLFTVHDEGICERKKGHGSLDPFIKILCERPSWADKHLPIMAEGWVGARYRK